MRDGNPDSVPFSDFTREVAATTGVDAAKLAGRLGATEYDTLLDDARERRDPNVVESAEDLPDALQRVLDSYPDALQLLLSADLAEFETSIHGIAMRDIRGELVAVPSKDEIAATLEENAELYEQKVAEGFDRLLLVPFGMPTENLLEKVGGFLGSIVRTERLVNCRGQTIGLNKGFFTDPIAHFRESEAAARQLSYCTEPDAPHRFTHTKEGIVSEDPAAGWQAILVEDVNKLDLVEMPGSAETRPLRLNRPRLLGGTTSHVALERLAGWQYRGEAGLTIESYLMMMLDAAQRYKVLLDVRGGCPLLGAYDSGSHTFDELCWEDDSTEDFPLLTAKRYSLYKTGNILVRDPRTCVPIVSSYTPASGAD